MMTGIRPFIKMRNGVISPLIKHQWPSGWENFITAGTWTAQNYVHALHSHRINVRYPFTTLHVHIDKVRQIQTKCDWWIKGAGGLECRCGYVYNSDNTITLGAVKVSSSPRALTCVAPSTIRINNLSHPHRSSSVWSLRRNLRRCFSLLL